MASAFVLLVPLVSSLCPLSLALTLPVATAAAFSLSSFVLFLASAIVEVSRIYGFLLVDCYIGIVWFKSGFLLK